MKKGSAAKLHTLLWGLAACLAVTIIVMHPEKAFASSMQGLTVWWELVFPALFPFLVAAQMLMAYGFAETAGKWLGPAARVLFGVPGIGGWAIAASFLAGYPAGAAITGQLRKQGMINQMEGERLLSASHVASPILIIGVVAAGFFHNARLGMILAVVHYGTAVGLGLMTRLVPAGKPAPSIPAAAFQLCADTEKLPGGFGKKLGEAVYQTAQTLFMIGGYMMLFSVILNVLQISHVTAWIENCLVMAAHALGMPEALSTVFMTGLMEVHLGAFSVSEQGIPAAWGAAGAAAVLSWSGLCIHFQVRSQVADTDIRYYPFLLSRIAHALLSAVVTLLAWKPLNHLFSALPAMDIPVMQTPEEFIGNASRPELWPYFSVTLLYTCMVLAGLSFSSRRSRKKE